MTVLMTLKTGLQVDNAFHENTYITQVLRSNTKYSYLVLKFELNKFNSLHGYCCEYVKTGLQA